MENLKRNRIHSQLFVILLLTAGIVLFWPTWSALVYGWQSDNTYSHGFLISLTCIVLMLGVARSTRPGDQQYKLPAALLLLLTGTIWLFAHLSAVQVVQAALLPVMLFFALVINYGIKSGLKFLFPLAFFLFAVPLWSVFTDFLQFMTIFVCDVVLESIRVPALVEGSFVYLPSGTFEIMAGCAGLHFFIVAFALGSLYSYLNLATVAYRISFLCISILLAIVVNWIRVITIILAGYRSDMQHYLVTVDHYAYGWVLFAVMLIPLFLIGRYLQNRECSKHSGIKRQDVNVSSIGFQPAPIALALILLSIMPLVALALDYKSEANVFGSITLPVHVGSWERRELPDDAWQAVFPGAQEYVTAQYVNFGFEIDVYANLYARQSQGAELVNQNNRLFDRISWRSGPLKKAEFNTISGGNVEIATFEVTSRGGRKQLFYTWYAVADRVLAFPASVKWIELRERLSGRGGSGLIALRTSCLGDCVHEIAMVSKFLTIHFDAINQSLTQTWDAGDRL